LQEAELNGIEDIPDGTYCKRVVIDIRDISRCNACFTLSMVFIDFLLQNAYVAFLFYYYFRENFVNEHCRKAYLAFLIVYMIITYIPKILMTFSNTVY
jgi:hypothetical protein